MANLVIRTNNPRAAAAARWFVATLAGKGSQGRELAEALLMRIGYVALSQIQADYVTKARGGTGRDGITWAALQRSTIAARRLGPYDPKPRNDGRRPYLTRSLDDEWRKIFATRKAWLQAKFGLTEREASQRAAQIAWARVKALGGETKLQVLGSREVEIGRDTGNLLNSLTPGVDGNILDVDLGRVTVGTNVPYAGPFHERRPLWPLNGIMPDDWWTPIFRATQRGILEAIASLLGGQTGST